MAGRAGCTPRRGLHVFILGAYQNAVREVRAKKDADEIRLIATEVLRNPYRKP